MYKLLVGGKVKRTTDSFSELMKLFKEYRAKETEPVTMEREVEDEES